jgi:hypothetical protein
MCIRFMPRNISDVYERDECTELARSQRNVALFAAAACVGSKAEKLEAKGCQEDRARPADAPCRRG